MRILYKITTKEVVSKFVWDEPLCFYYTYSNVMNESSISTISGVTSCYRAFGGIFD
ncbi:hypothetical protein JCM6292_2126 [Bacteroides pyogenes JCM 6292]|uniref:Uncharacterized protein n=1 Tax=Bacteroides pyogenes JCM 6292 TaxID=1235809 RepID=W4P8R6_9BACE|nr:hypothetical protein JCM6292_2126 [Bacteroides pyogenes JCM 6292]